MRTYDDKIKMFIKTKILLVKLDLFGHRAQTNQKGFLKGEQKIDFLKIYFLLTL